MSDLLDLKNLIEMYPDQGGRIKFLRRAKAILHMDRIALQDALARHAYEQARQLVHRLQGTASFLTGSPDNPDSVFRPLNEALKQHNATRSYATQAEVLQYLNQLEEAVSEAIHPSYA
jgi:hypothetical protein